MDNELQALLALTSLLAANVQVNSAFYNAISAYMRRRQAIIRSILDNSHVQQHRACPVLENGHMIRIFSRFNVGGDQF